MDKQINAWEHLAKGSWGSDWPWSDLVSMFHKYKPNLSMGEPKRHLKVLELGMGTGANFPFFENLPVNYLGIDFSSSAIRRARTKFPSAASCFLEMDFSRHFPEVEFDVIVDRASIINNTTSDISKILNSVYQHLSPNGVFMGIDWFTKNHSDWNLETEKIDEDTKTNFKEGQFVGMGKINFTEMNQMKKFLQEFEILTLTEKIYTTYLPTPSQFAAFNFAARKIS